MNKIELFLIFSSNILFYDYFSWILIFCYKIAEVLFKIKKFDDFFHKFAAKVHFSNILTKFYFFKVIQSQEKNSI